MKNFFFGAHGDIATQIANFLFNSKGDLIFRNLKDFPFFQSQYFSHSKFLNIKLSIRPFRMEKTLNLMNADLKNKVLIEG